MLNRFYFKLEFYLQHAKKVYFQSKFNWMKWIEENEDKR